MSSKEKDAPLWRVALIPFFGEVRVGGTLQPRWDEAIFIDDDATEEERKHFYQTLTKQIGWLPRKARGAILQALGSSLTKQNAQNETRRMVRLQHQITVLKRPLKEIAAAEGISVATLKQQLHRFRKGERSAVEGIRKRAAKMKPRRESPGPKIRR